MPTPQLPTSERSLPTQPRLLPGTQTIQRPRSATGGPVTPSHLQMSSALGKGLTRPPGNLWQVCGVGHPRIALLTFGPGSSWLCIIMSPVLGITGFEQHLWPLPTRCQ